MAVYTLDNCRIGEFRNSKGACRHQNRGIEGFYRKNCRYCDMKDRNAYKIASNVECSEDGCWDRQLIIQNGQRRSKMKCCHEWQSRSFARIAWPACVLDIQEPKHRSGAIVTKKYIDFVSVSYRSKSLGDYSCPE